MGIESLLELDGERFEVCDGYWVKFDVRLVQATATATATIPHGIGYSLTLHRPDSTRILGFDNAHALRPAGNPFKHVGQVFAYDHKHPYLRAPIPYRFDSPEQLLTDFWDAVDDALSREGV